MFTFSHHHYQKWKTKREEPELFSKRVSQTHARETADEMGFPMWHNPHTLPSSFPKQSQYYKKVIKTPYVLIRFYSLEEYLTFKAYKKQTVSFFLTIGREMATKKAFVLAFLMVLIFSASSVLGEESTMQQAKDKASHAASTAKGAASEAVEDVKETTSSWADWLKDKFD